MEELESENICPNVSKAASVPVCKPDPALKTTDPLRCIGQLKRATQRKQESPLPKPFPLPQNFIPAVAFALQEKKLTGKTRAKFVTALANSVFIYKSYPTSRELEDVCREVIKKWEFLGTSSGIVSFCTLQ